MANDLYALGPRAMQQLRDLIRSEGGRQSPIQNPLRRRHVVSGGDSGNSIIVPLKEDMIVMQSTTIVGTQDYIEDTDSPVFQGLFLPNIVSDIEENGIRILSSGDPYNDGIVSFAPGVSSTYEIELYCSFEVSLSAPDNDYSDVICNTARLAASGYTAIGLTMLPSSGMTMGYFPVIYGSKLVLYGKVLMTTNGGYDAAFNVGIQMSGISGKGVRLTSTSATIGKHYLKITRHY